MILRYKYINEEENHKHIDRSISILKTIIALQVMFMIFIIGYGLFAPVPKQPANQYINYYGGN